MPYQQVTDLPKPVQEQYNPKQLASFLAAFNRAFDSTHDESSAFAIAHTAAQHGSDTKAVGIKWLDNNRFIAVYTNAYEDRDGEWFAEKGIEADLARMQATNDYPQLWFYHIPNSQFGQVDAAFKVGRFAVALGYVFPDAISQSLKAYAEAEGYTLSHGFSFAPEAYHNRTYHDFSTFEISPLPADKASNPYTQFLAVPSSIGDTMATKQIRINPLALEALHKALGEDNTKLFLAGLVSQSKTLDSTTAHKATDEAKEAVIELETEAEEAAPEGGPPDMMKAFDERLRAMEDKMGMALEDLKGLFEKRYGMDKKEADANAAIKMVGATGPAQFTPEQLAMKAMQDDVAAMKAQLQERAKSIQDTNVAALIADYVNHSEDNTKQVQSAEFDPNVFAKMAFGGTPQ